MKQRLSGSVRMALAVLMLVQVAACERRAAVEPTGSLPGPASGSSASPPAARSGSAVADAAITARVKAALQADRDLRSVDIAVDTVNGVVTLSGTIDTPHNLERATRVAKAVDGVSSVSNQMNVKAPT